MQNSHTSPIDASVTEPDVSPVAEPNVNNEPQNQQDVEPKAAPVEPVENADGEAKPVDDSVGLLDSDDLAPQGEESEEKAEPESAVLGAPEAYSFEENGTAIPVEGNAMLSSFSEIARELNLSQDAVSKIYAKVAPTIMSKPQEAVAQLRRDGLAACKVDPEFGGAKFAENVAVSKRAYNDQRLVTPELQALLKDSGLNSHPEVVRLFYRIGKLTSSGQVIQGGSKPKATDYRGRYPNTKMNP